MNNASELLMVCQRCIAENEHGINKRKSNEYKTISTNTEGPREGHKTQRGPTGGNSKSGRPKGANKRGP